MTTELGQQKGVVVDASLDPGVGFALLGTSMHSAPMDVQERLALSRDEVERVYHGCLEASAVDDAIVLATCNRTEFYVSGRFAPGDGPPLLRELLADVVGEQRLPAEQFCYTGVGRESLRHLFKVSCGLDSVVLGETQILGQVKSAYEESREFFRSAPLERVAQAALRSAARIRTETEIGAGTVSVASAAVHLCSRVFSDLGHKKVLVIGAGDTGRLLVQHFDKRLPERITVVNRNASRARALADSVDGRAFGLDGLAEALVDADVIAAAVDVAEPIVTAEMVAGAVRRGGRRTIVALDLGMPRNIDPKINDITNVFVHDIEALKHVVDHNLKRRRGAVTQACGVIDDELDKLMAAQRSLRAKPLVVALRQAVERTRRAEVEKCSKGLSAAEVEAVERATKAVVNKLLHGPTTGIQEYARRAQANNEGLQAIRALFSNLDLPGNS